MFGAVWVQGSSMAPAIRDGDVLLARAAPPSRGALRRGAIVTWAPARLGGRVLLKRIVRLPGERVRCRGEGGSVTHEQVLGSEEYFLLGDDGRDSLDSRRLGPARRSDVRAVVWRRLWPPIRLFSTF